MPSAALDITFHRNHSHDDRAAALGDLGLSEVQGRIGVPGAGGFAALSSG